MSDAADILSGVAQIAQVLSDLLPGLLAATPAADDTSATTVQTGDILWTYNPGYPYGYVTATNVSVPNAKGNVYPIVLQFATTSIGTVQQGPPQYLKPKNNDKTYPVPVTPYMKSYSSGIVTMASSRNVDPSGSNFTTFSVRKVSLGAPFTISSAAGVSALVEGPDSAPTITFNLQNGFSGRFSASISNAGQSATVAADLSSTSPTSLPFTLPPFLQIGSADPLVDAIDVTLVSNDADVFSGRRRA